MSDIYVKRLSAIADELDVTVAALAFVTRNIHLAQVANDPIFSLYPTQNLKRAARNIETTFFVRLTAEFEGILKDHLRTNWPQILFPAKKSEWKLDWFLNRALKQEGITLSLPHRVRLNAVRDYRNSIAHRDVGVLLISFREALSAYNSVVGRLPNPHS